MVELGDSPGAGTCRMPYTLAATLVVLPEVLVPTGRFNGLTEDRWFPSKFTKFVGVGVVRLLGSSGFSVRLRRAVAETSLKNVSVAPEFGSTKMLVLP